MKEKPKEESEYKGCLKIVLFIVVFLAWLKFSFIASNGEWGYFSGLAFIPVSILLGILISFFTKGDKK